MFWILFISVLLFSAWLCYDVFKQTSEIEDTIDDPTTTCWDDDDENKNHTEGDFH